MFGKNIVSNTLSIKLSRSINIDLLYMNATKIEDVKNPYTRILDIVLSLLLISAIKSATNPHIINNKNIVRGEDTIISTK